jgi:hypothetical protein
MQRIINTTYYDVKLKQNSIFYQDLKIFVAMHARKSKVENRIGKTGTYFCTFTFIP